MSKQIILLVTHGHPSTNKLLLRSIQQKGLDTKFAMIVSYKGRDTLTGKAQYTLELYISKLVDISEEQRSLMTLLPGSDEVLYLENIAEKFFLALLEVGSGLTFRNFTDVFEFHLFTEVNLTCPGGECITKEFRDSVHIFGDYFKGLVMPCHNCYYVYGFSNTQIAREKARMFFDGRLVDDLELMIGIDSYVVDIKENLRSYVIREETVVLSMEVHEKPVERINKVNVPVKQNFFCSLEEFSKKSPGSHKSSDENARIRDGKERQISFSPVEFFEDKGEIREYEFSQTFEDSYLREPLQEVDPDLDAKIMDDTGRRIYKSGIRRKLAESSEAAFFKYTSRTTVIPQKQVFGLSIDHQNADIALEGSSIKEHATNDCCIIS